MVGPKYFDCPLAFFGFISSWLALTNLFDLSALLKENITFHLFRQQIGKMFMINAISDARIQTLVIFEGC